MPQITDVSDSPSRQHVGRMFDRIAHRYDLLNRMLSFGRDTAWRKRLAKHLPPVSQRKILDLATGTADVLLSLERRNAVAHGIGADLSAGMLHFGHEKIRRRKLEKKIQLMQTDAMKLALASDTFDAVTISFGIRNVADVPAGLREMHRILKPGGRALILEFSLPGNLLFRAIYLFYFRHVLPIVGGLISGDDYAYRYLNKTVETFPYGEEFCALMRDAGYTNVVAYPLTMGIATLYVGDK